MTTTTTTTDAAAISPLANATRPRREIQWQRKISAIRTVTETRQVYADVTQIDAMMEAGLFGEREARAALRLYGLFLAAGLAPRSTQRQDVAPEVLDDEDYSAAEDVPENEKKDARVVYRGLLVGLGQTRGPTLDSLMHGTLPPWHAGAAIAALGVLVDQWGFE